MLRNESVSARRCNGHGDQAVQFLRRSKAEKLCSQGLRAESSGALDDALSAFKEALPIFRAIGDGLGEGTCLNGLGVVYRDLDRPQQALEYFSQALAVRRRMGDHLRVAITLMNVGATYLSLERPQDALEQFQRALNTSRSAGDRGLEGGARHHLGRAYHQLGLQEEALQYFDQALEISKELGDSKLQCVTLTYAGDAWRSLERRGEAAARYHSALAIGRKLGDPRAVSINLLSLLSAYPDRTWPDEALPYLTEAKEALTWIHEQGNRETEVLASHAVGDIFRELGQRQEALKHLQDGLAIVREMSDQSLEAKILNSLGLVCQDLGRSEALDHFHQAVAILRQIGDRPGEGATLTNLAASLLHRGRFQEAVESLGQAVTIAGEVNDPTAEGAALNSLAVVYQFLGALDAAEVYHKRALDLFRKAGHARGEAACLNCLATVYEDLGSDEKALKHHRQALNIYRAEGDWTGEMHALSGIGHVYLTAGDLDEALDRYTECIRIFSARRGDLASLPGFSVDVIGEIYRQQGKTEQALQTYEEGIVLYRKAGHRHSEAFALGRLGDLLLGLGRPAEALERYGQATEILENMRVEIVSEDPRTSYFSTVADMYARYASLLVAQGQTKRALHVAERRRARVLLELLTEAHAEVREGLDPELLDEQSALLARLRALQQRLVELRFQPQEQDIPQLIVEIEREEQETERKYQLNQAEIRRCGPRYASLTQPEIWNVEEIQEELVDDRTALLEYVLGDQQGLLFVVLKNDCEAFLLPPKAEIETMVRELREAVSRRDVAGYPQGHELYQALINREVKVSGRKRRVVEMIEGKTLLIIADGVLHYLPFEILLTEPPKEVMEPRPPARADKPRPNAGDSDMGHGRPGTLVELAAPSYLVCRHAIVYAPSASVAGLLQREQEHREVWPHELVAIADPALPEEEGGRGQPVVMEAALDHVTRGVSLRPIPGTREEVTRIASLIEPTPQLQEVVEGKAHQFDGERVTLCLGKRATKEAVLARFDPKAEVPASRFVHFATHGLLDEEKPQFSGLVFSPGPSGDSFWHTFEIFNARIPADLVVLSACETGLGKIVSGEGVVGLARAFMYAGSGSVCVSLWKVADLATADFMEAFYRQLLHGRHQDGAPVHKAEALRQAKLEAIDAGGRTAHPYFWAPFVLVGRGR